MRTRPGGQVHAPPPPDPDPAPEDRDLVLRLQDGDRAAASLVWERHAPTVLRLLRRTLGEHDVDDLLQEVFIRVFGKVATIVKPEALRSYIIGTAIRVATWEIRRRKVRRIVSFSRTGEMPDVPIAAPDHAARQALSAFAALLDDLKPVERSVFVLRFMEELTVREIAEALDVSESTTKRLLGRALERVLRRMQDHPALVDYASRLKVRDV